MYFKLVCNVFAFQILLTCRSHIVCWLDSTRLNPSCETQRLSINQWINQSIVNQSEFIHINKYIQPELLTIKIENKLFILPRLIFIAWVEVCASGCIQLYDFEREC